MQRACVGVPRYLQWHNRVGPSACITAGSTPLAVSAALQLKAVLDKDYVPNFKTAFDHFLVHTGGRAVIEEVEKKLRLDPADVQPSKETLFRYGNTCCAAVFYVLTNMEARVRHTRAPIKIKTPDHAHQHT